MSDLNFIFEQLGLWVSEAPVPVFFLALVVFPLVGIPVSPLWIALGLRLGIVSGVVLAMVALLLNFSISYWIALRIVRGKFRTFLERKGSVLLRQKETNEKRWILLVRITPGFPLFFQNNLLGMSRVNFWRYLILSLPVQTIYAALFISLGDSVSSSGWTKVLMILFGIVATGLLVSILRSHLLARSRTIDSIQP